VTPEERLRHSLAEFRATLESLGPDGVSQVAAIRQLKILVTRYPDHTRRFLAVLDRPSRGGRHRARGRP
jgi:hypothetical protein